MLAVPGGVMHRTSFKAPAVAYFAMLALGSVSLFIAYAMTPSDNQWTILFFVCFGIACIVGFFESYTSYILLEEDALSYRKYFAVRRVPKEEISKVTWEKGSGVALQLTDGSWVWMPELLKNSQSLTNSIRAWLSRGVNE